MTPAGTIDGTQSSNVGTLTVTAPAFVAVTDITFASATNVSVNNYLTSMATSRPAA